MKIISTLLLTAFVALARADKKYPRGYVRSVDANTTEIKLLSITDAMLDATPDDVDWADNLTPIKDQGNCGSCWAFSSVSTAESALYMGGHFKEPTEISTEELVDCVKGDGCRGGDITDGIDYLKKHGTALASDYPDTSSDARPAHKSSCKIKEMDVMKKIKGRKFAVPECSRGDCSDSDEEALAAALAHHGPIAICVNSEGWENYEGGVMKRKCGAKANKIDHCVQLVGYSKTASEPYWKIRNSWADDWGEDGFIRIPYGQGNKCCVACEALIIEVEDA
ncbi:hypothetical protein TrRE_jg9997 [Triparma retinervis]|uniref:Peptidase C1A papain C-terminal domain-containing protein n=1 Tax=Triparma retinervis TaxID=2557542 RepID=A0A9W7AEU0_9STRA|nr:hypothetical protein TrRE_jg9997 [Triparma retinervis]